MLTCNEIRPAGTWDEAIAADPVVLGFDGRYCRRFGMTGEAGLAFLLDLPRATRLRGGDGLVLRDGAVVRVRATPGHHIEIAAPNLTAVVRTAWHLGNRHLPTQILEDRLRIRDDRVTAEMVRSLGGTITPVEAAFDPEGGAFGHDTVRGHNPDPDHPHDHAHRHG